MTTYFKTDKTKQDSGGKYESECIISGVIGFVLRVLRLIGQAPVVFHEGRRMCLSRNVTIYSHFMVMFSIIISMVALGLDLAIGLKVTLFSRRNYQTLIWVIDVVLMNIVCYVGVCTSVNRMRRIIESVTLLDQIDQDLESYQKSTRNEKIKWVVTTCALLFGGGNALLNFGLVNVQPVEGNHLIFLTTFYIFNKILWITQDFMVSLLVLLIVRVLSTFQHLNRCLNDILREIYKESVCLEPTPGINEDKHKIIKNNTDNDKVFIRLTNKSINHVIDSLAINRGLVSERTTPRRIRHLSHIYCTLCEVLRKLSDSNGLLLVLLFLAFLLHIIIAVVFFLKLIFLRSRLYFPFRELAWIVNYFGKVFYIAEPCHRTHEQIELTRRLVHQMMRYTPSHDYPVMNELKLFSRHITLNQAVYTPLRFFTLDRLFLIAFLGSVTTYVVVLMKV